MSDEKSPSGSTQDGEEQNKTEELIDTLPPEERKKWNEKFLQLEYYKAISKTIFQVVKDFSKWAVLLMSGVGSMVGGWFSLRKMAKKEKVEIKKIEANAEMRSKRREHRREEGQLGKSDISTGKPTLEEARHAGGQRQYSLSPESKKEESREDGVGRAGVVRKELETPITELQLQAPIVMNQMDKLEPFYTDPAILFTVVSIPLFLITAIKMFIYDKFKKKKEGK